MQASHISNKIVSLLTIIVLFAALLPTSTASGASNTKTFKPVADAYTDSSKPGKNFGKGASIAIDGSPKKQGFLRFKVSGLKGRAVENAVLRLWTTDDSHSGFDLYTVESNNWKETGMTFNTAPALGSRMAATGSYNKGQWLEINVKNVVTKEGQFSFALAAAQDTTTSIASRAAGGKSPQLVLTLAGQADPTAAPTKTPKKTAAPKPTATPKPTTPPPGDSKNPKPVGQSGSWNLIFRDEFNGSDLNSKVWHTCFWWASTTCTIESNREQELYNAGDVIVQDGKLRLRAQKRNMTAWNGKTYNYTSGLVITGGRKGQKAPGFTFKYGYAEARVKVPAGKGLWPAFWLLPVDYESRPEIDVMEILGHEPWVQHMNYHYPGGDKGSSWSGPDFSKDWHTFAIDWTPSAIVWYVDGVERYRFTDKSHISNEPEYLLLNLAVGGNWPGSPNSSTRFPAYFDVDYVRVWQRP